MNPSCVRLSFLYLLLSCLLYSLTESETSSYTWRLELTEGKIVADLGNAAAAAAGGGGGLPSPGDESQVWSLPVTYA